MKNRSLNNVIGGAQRLSIIAGRHQQALS